MSTHTQLAGREEEGEFKLQLVCKLMKLAEHWAERHHHHRGQGHRGGTCLSNVGSIILVLLHRWQGPNTRRERERVALITRSVSPYRLTPTPRRFCCLCTINLSHVIKICKIFKKYKLPTRNMHTSAGTHTHTHLMRTEVRIFVPARISGREHASSISLGLSSA